MRGSSTVGAGSNGEGGLEVEALVEDFDVAAADDEGLPVFTGFLLLPFAILPQSRGQQEATASMYHWSRPSKAHLHNSSSGVWKGNSTKAVNAAKAIVHQMSILVGHPAYCTCRRQNGLNLDHVC